MLVLTDSIISNILKSLSIAELQGYQTTLKNALLEYHNDHSIIPPRVVTATEYGCTHLFMTSKGTRVGMKAITASKEGLKGITTILDRETGYPLAVINGATLTAFRTALCTSLGLVKTFPVGKDYGNEDTLVVFGVGDQAIWHLRLALILYPKRFNRVICVNRTLEKAATFCDDFSKENNSSGIEFIATTSADPKLASYFENTSVIFTCVPTTSPHVTKELVERCQSRVFIGAIGSYKPQMIEVEGDLMKDLVLKKGGKIIVDSKEHCLHEAGEFIQNNIGEESLVEYSTIFSEAMESGSEQFEFLTKCPVVVSKIVGLCIMDVWVGQHCMNQAQSLHQGIEINNF